ncbi:hypothetical protein HDU97_007755 [Phlyctochytrium planicorne]|nr:hypothetical protein HDU97_007755 [Phlyctochytrium planicorne]
MQIKNVFIAAALCLATSVFAEEAPAVDAVVAPEAVEAVEAVAAPEAVVAVEDVPAAAGEADQASSLLGAAADAVSGAVAGAANAVSGAVNAATGGTSINCWTGPATDGTFSQSKAATIQSLGDACQAAKLKSDGKWYKTKTYLTACNVVKNAVGTSLSLYSEVNCCQTDLCNNNGAGAMGTNLLLSAGVAVAISFYSFF